MGGRRRTAADAYLLGTAQARFQPRRDHFRSRLCGTRGRRARDAVYDYLQTVFAIVMHFKVRRRTNKLLRHAFEFANQPIDKNADPFTAVIRCTSDGQADNKTISKWARALRYVAECKKPSTRLRAFVTEAGGVNACAARYAKLKRRRNRRN
jgi:hypothetical protein